MRVLRPRLLLPVVLFTVAAAGCCVSSAPTTAATDLTVRERDFAITLPIRTVAAGDVVLRAVNRGPDAHELIVVRADSAALPLRSDGLTVDEDALKKVTVGALEPDRSGTVRDLRVHLKPGRYVFFCNMSGHFMGGMHTTLIVR